MFRLTKTERGSRSVVTIDGQLSADAVDVVRNVCQQAIQAGQAVQVFLRDVSSIDPAGRVLLRELTGRGVELMAKGVYTSFLIRELTGVGGELQKPEDRPLPHKI
jgi:hypothetical protein